MVCADGLRVWRSCRNAENQSGKGSASGASAFGDDCAGGRAVLMLPGICPGYGKKMDNHSYPSKMECVAKGCDNQIMENLLPNVDLWAQRTSKARNDLAHRGASKNVPPLEMSAMVSVTVAVVVISLISQLGIPTSRILQALEQTPRTQTCPRPCPQILASKRS
jgi:hypothetical protein